MRNRLVNFKINDVYFPDPARLLRQLHGEDLLQGKVIEVSESADVEGRFVVVEVEGLNEPVVVPVARIEGIL